MTCSQIIGLREHDLHSFRTHLDFHWVTVGLREHITYTPSELISISTEWQQEQVIYANNLMRGILKLLHYFTYNLLLLHKMLNRKGNFDNLIHINCHEYWKPLYN